MHIENRESCIPEQNISFKYQLYDIFCHFCEVVQKYFGAISYIVLPTSIFADPTSVTEALSFIRDTTEHGDLPLAGEKINFLKMLKNIPILGINISTSFVTV